MHDRFLDGLSDYLIRLSRVPGLGFLERHATAATWLKHDIEGYLGDIGEKQQGLEEGYELLQETFGKKKKAGETPAGAKAGAEVTAPGQVDAGQADAGQAATGPADAEEQSPTPASALQAKRAQTKSLRATPAKSTDAQFKQKLMMKTIKRRRY